MRQGTLGIPWISRFNHWILDLVELFLNLPVFHSSKIFYGIDIFTNIIWSSSLKRKWREYTSIFLHWNTAGQQPRIHIHEGTFGSSATHQILLFPESCFKHTLKTKMFPSKMYFALPNLKPWLRACWSEPEISPVLVFGVY